MRSDFMHSFITDRPKNRQRIPQAAGRTSVASEAGIID